MRALPLASTCMAKLLPELIWLSKWLTVEKLHAGERNHLFRVSCSLHRPQGVCHVQGWIQGGRRVQGAGFGSTPLHVSNYFAMDDVCCTLVKAYLRRPVYVCGQLHVELHT